MKPYIRRVLCVSFLNIALFAVWGAQAQEETSTAGSSMGKEVEGYQGVQPYSEERSAGTARTEGQWIPDGNSWWDQYSDGTWTARS